VDVTDVWVDVEEGSEVDFSYGVGDLCSITEDVWVSPSGSDESHLGTSEGEAFLTIQRALEMIAPEDDDPITIFLTGGTANNPDIFAPSTTGEDFPIFMISNVNLIGAGEEVTIIDAEETGRVITMEDCDNNIISDLAITGGLAVIVKSEIILLSQSSIVITLPVSSASIIVTSSPAPIRFTLEIIKIGKSSPVVEGAKISGLLAVPPVRKIVIGSSSSGAIISKAR
jgi:hypothetical protein